MMDSDDVIAVILQRNLFYRRQYLLAFAAFLLTLIVIFFLAWIAIFLYKNPTAPLYFATDNVSRLIKIVPVDQPNMSTDDAAAWAVEAVQKAYSYDYVNYRSQLQSAEKYFTAYGWSKYVQALAFSGNLLALTERKQIVISQVVDKPKVLAEGILNGSYAYKFQIPLLVTYWLPPYDDKPENRFSNAINVNVIVQRQNVLQGYQGLGIVQLIATLAAQAPQTPELQNTPDS